MEFFKKLKLKENKIILQRLWAVFKIIFHTSLVITDIISDLVYVTTVDFYTQTLKGFCILFIIVIPFLIYSITLGAIIKAIVKRRKNNNSTKHYIVFAVFWIFLGPGISVLYPALEKFELMAPPQVRLFFQLSTIEFFGESLPQLIIQGINNSLNNSWTSFTKFSFTISLMSLIRGCYVLATTWYRRQYETYLDQIEEDTSKIIKQKLTSESNTLGNVENIDILIKYKFYEKFYLNKVLFDQSHDASFKSNQKLHLKIEDTINVIYQEKCGLNFEFYSFIRRLMHPLNLLIFLELLMASIVWFCNLLYLVIADFHNESIRFILMFFLGLGYIISIAGSFKDIKGVTFRKFLILRLCMVSHFDYLVKLFFEKVIETTNNLISEALIIVFCWVPVIAIEAKNNDLVGKKSGIYMGVVVLNSFYLIIIAFRVFHILIKNISTTTEENISTKLSNKVINKKDKEESKGQEENKDKNGNKDKKKNEDKEESKNENSKRSLDSNKGSFYNEDVSKIDGDSQSVDQ